VGFEPTITASERANTVHVLDRSATVTSNSFPLPLKKNNLETANINQFIDPIEKNGSMSFGGRLRHRVSNPITYDLQ
jgi:hypothetical protein